MSLFEKDDRYLDDERESGVDPLSIVKIIGFLFAVLFAPTAAVSMLIFFVFVRQLRWKPRVTIVPLTIMFLILALFSSGPLSYINIHSIKNNTSLAIGGYLYLSLMLGIVAGFFLILYKTHELKKYPEYKQIRGWAYGFEFVPTPLDKLRKKKNIQSLIEGQEFDYERAPIGVLEEPVKHDDLEGTLDTKNADRASIVYRYYSEAMAHTLITGKTGSGKALHIDTEIRCKEKGWVTVGDIEVGDTIYNERGNHTKVEAIYQPMTEDHYEITFDNGEVVKACGDHLWNIGNVDDNNTICTRDLLKNYSYNTEYEIKHTIDGLSFTHKILQIKRIKDEPADYLCFTVDSDSHLFLITKSYIPTHNTVTMLSLIQNDILAGNPVCVIDFKKSPDFIYFLSKWAKEEGREFFHFTNGRPGTYRNPYKDDQATYDPLSTGKATAKADMILNLRTWDSASEVYKLRTQDVLQSLFFLLERTPRKAVPGIDWSSGGLAQFVSALDLNNFKAMIEYMAKDKQAGKLSQGDVRRYNTLVELYKELSSKTKSDLKAQILELLSIARTLIVSNYGDWLAKGASKYHIDLMSIATSDKAPIVLFSFNQQEEPEFAKYIGSIVMSDLSRVSALKNAKDDTTRFGVYIDEFQTLDPITVKDSLEKARNSRMYITLSLQSIDQIISSAQNQGEAIAKGILDTIANFIFHDGSGYDTTEKMSKIIGKSQKYVYKTTSKPANKLFKYRLMSVDEEIVQRDIQEDWLISPSEFQSLESPTNSNGYKATAYVLTKSPNDNRFKRNVGALARKVHVVVAKETSDGVPKGFKKEIFIPQAQDMEFQEIQAKREIEANENYNNAQIDDESYYGEQISDIHNGDWAIVDLDEEVEDLDTIQDIEKNILPDISTFNIGKEKSKTKENPKVVEEPVSQLDNFKKLKSQSKISNKNKKLEENKFTLPKLD